MAAMCPNGTVNWKQIYGEEAFLLRPPVYESDLRAKRKAKEFDVADIEKRAKEYAQASVDARTRRVGRCALRRMQWRSRQLMMSALQGADAC